MSPELFANDPYNHKARLRRRRLAGPTGAPCLSLFFVDLRTFLFFVYLRTF